MRGKHPVRPPASGARTRPQKCDRMRTRFAYPVDQPEDDMPSALLRPLLRTGSGTDVMDVGEAGQMRRVMTRQSTTPLPASSSPVPVPVPTPPPVAQSRRRPRAGSTKHPPQTTRPQPVPRQSVSATSGSPFGRTPRLCAKVRMPTSPSKLATPAPRMLPRSF